jgi:hypothetical protein
METLKGELTILAISHNRAMVDTADRVYQLSPTGAVLVNSSTQSGVAK